MRLARRGCDAERLQAKKQRTTIEKETKEDFSMAELNITAANFENEVLHSDKPVLLDFYANWCGPCKMLSPVLRKLAEENVDALMVVERFHFGAGGDI